MILEKLVIPIGFDTGLLMEGIRAIEGLITGAIDRTRDWADEMDTLGEVTGLSDDKLAAWAYVAKKAGVEIETLSSATVIMVKGLLDSKGELSTTGKALEDFGVNVLDVGGKVRDQSDLMNDISKKYAEFGTQTERIDFLTNVFGRSGAKLVDYFETMAQEGGIDKVKDKVGQLGLVLDSAAYEDFQRNLNEVQVTITGLANAFTGPLLPGAEKLLQTFVTWLQQPWIADGIAYIGEEFAALAKYFALGIETGNWFWFFEEIKKITGVDLQPIVAEFQKVADWVTNVGIPAFLSFIDSVKTGFADFQNSSSFETSMIKKHWQELLDAIGERFRLIFGGEGKQLIIDWKAIGITALQLIDLTIIGITKTWEFFNNGLEKTIGLFKDIKDSFSTTSVYVPPGTYSAPESGGSGAPFRASGGSASGLTWVGDKGVELVDAPSGSQVYNNQASASMGFDYYKLAAILAVEFAKARD
jgi:hypothetical protein